MDKGVLLLKPLRCVPGVSIFCALYKSYQGLIESKEKRACNMVPIILQTEAKNSNKLGISYDTNTANVTKNSTVLLEI